MPTPRNRTPAQIRLIRVELVAEATPVSSTLTGPEMAGTFLREFIGTNDREHFVVLHLNGKHRVVSCETVSVGSLNTTLVHPREVFKAAILSNAAAIICGHNHPSGDTEPSREDRLVLRRIKEVGELLGIPLLDFLIVTATGFRSLGDEISSTTKG